MRADVPGRQAWATRQGSLCASPAEGVGMGADWLGRPHLPRWASKFVSLSDRQPHRCLHPITKQYLATLLFPRGQSKTELTRTGGLPELSGLATTYLQRRLAPTSLPRGARCQSHVPRRSLYPSASLDCHVPLARPTWSNLPTASAPVEESNFTMCCLSWGSMTRGCNGTDEQTCRARRSQPSETG